SQPTALAEAFYLIRGQTRILIPRSQTSILNPRDQANCLKTSQPTLSPPVSSHIQPALSTSALQEHLYLHQCINQRTTNVRGASFSQGTWQKSDTAIQRVAQGNRHYINRVSSQVHGFYSLPKPNRHNTKFKESTYNLPHSLASHRHVKSSLTGSEIDNEDAYTFKTPNNTLCQGV
ncbi:hypothetical protein A6R68_03574, partial [Neotoma lepida]